ncbi:MAG: hypothetical protein HY558_07255, partial [Euryarchaeota archaeon]|nr:hypothetical protein [Euryarchaeota archaeon]
MRIFPRGPAPGDTGCIPGVNYGGRRPTFPWMHPAGDPGAAALEATAADGGKEGSQRPADLERRRRCPPAAIAAVFGTSIITWDETQFPDPWNSKGRWVPNLGYAEIDGVWY